MSEKLTKCKACGAEMADSAKTCPKCGAKNKKPFYKKWWFYVIVALFVVGAVGGAGSTGNKAGTTTQSGSPGGSAASYVAGSAGNGAASAAEVEPVSYTHYDVTELFDALKDNALKAEKTFQDQYVELEGYLSVIDSDGKYIAIGADPSGFEYVLQDVQCYIKSEEQREQVAEMSTGDAIVVRGKITSIGELLGYQMNIDSIN